MRCAAGLILAMYLIWFICAGAYCAAQPERYSINFAQQTIGCQNHHGFKESSKFDYTATCRDGYTFDYTKIYGEDVFELSAKYKLENKHLFISLITLGLVQYN